MVATDGMVKAATTVLIKRSGIRPTSILPEDGEVYKEYVETARYMLEAALAAMTEKP